MIRKFYQSSIGKKWIVALTGLVLIGYVIGHLIGNLQVFVGPEQINAYGAFLHGHVFLLWLVRIFLLVCFFLHIVFTIKLAIENRQARPECYAVTKRVQASIAGRTMVWSGLIVLCFVVYHLLHFTAQVTNPEFRQLEDSAGRHDVYAMLVRGFNNPFASGFYILGMFLLCSHLSHGFGSFFQTMGLNSQRLAPVLVNGGRILAWLIFVGYVSIPIAVMTGLLHL
jgi:succinate dehydrogenase / fumarate reductase cytochrome b subunit